MGRRKDKRDDDPFVDLDGEALPPREVMSTLAFDPALTPPPLVPLDQPTDAKVDYDPAPPQGTE